MNLEYLAKVVVTGQRNGRRAIYPDTVFGTDSHTTMTNGLGVLGWGVGGIEAEAAMLGQPSSMLIPSVVGFRLHGALRPASTATDLVLRVTEILRKKGVVGKFVEFFGPGLGSLSLADRATIANMAPEYGATMGYFPVDAQTLAYLRFTGRDRSTLEAIETYYRRQGLFTMPMLPTGTTPKRWNSTLGPSSASPVPSDGTGGSAQSKKPSGRRWYRCLTKGRAPGRTLLTAGFGGRGARIRGEAGIPQGDPGFRQRRRSPSPRFRRHRGDHQLHQHQASVMMPPAGAQCRGEPHQTVGEDKLAPGSKVVTEYLRLQASTFRLIRGFNLVGYGCTCIGNGPLGGSAGAVQENDLVAVSVLSGQNFGPDQPARAGELRPLRRWWWPTPSPGRWTSTSLTTRSAREGQHAVFLKDLWPTPEITATINSSLTSEMFRRRTGSSTAMTRGRRSPFRGSDSPGRTVDLSGGALLRRNVGARRLSEIAGMRVLALWATRPRPHFAGWFDQASGPAGKPDRSASILLISIRTAPAAATTVMMRGTFANIRLRNLLAPGTEGGDHPSRCARSISIFDAAALYRVTGTPLMVIAGKEYGSGSSRDWTRKDRTCSVSVWSSPKAMSGSIAAT